jgi:hypothetical protein
MAKIADGVLKIWSDGMVVTASDYHQEREMLRTAVNDTDTRVDTVNQNITDINNSINSLSTNKANVGDSYTKTEANTLLNAKANTGTSYTKAESDTNYYGKSSVYTKTESDANYYGKSSVYTKTEIDATNRDHKGTWQGYTPSTLQSNVVSARGNNANGQYIQYANGDMDVWGTLNITTDIASSYGSLYTTPLQTITFPQTFIATPDSCSLLAFTTNGGYTASVRGNTITSSTVSFFLDRTTSQTAQSFAVKFHAKGKWK